MGLRYFLSFISAVLVIAAVAPGSRPGSLLAGVARPAGGVPQAEASGLAEAASASLAESEGAFKVEWSLVATGNDDRVSQSHLRTQLAESHRVDGIAIVRPETTYALATDPYFSGTTTTFKETHNWNFVQFHTFPCEDPPGTYRSILRMWVTDPDRHSGVGPKAGLPNPSRVTFPLPQRRADGSWFMREPFDITQTRAHDEKHVSRTVHCSGKPTGWESGGVDGVGPGFQPQILEGDARGVTFSLTHRYRTAGVDSEAKMMLDVVRRVMVTRLPGSGSISQQAELDERGIYLPTIPLAGNWHGLLDCRDLLGCLIRREIQSAGAAPAIENIGPTQDKTVPKTIQIGSLPPGRTRITAQATGSSGADAPSPPDIKLIQVARKLPHWLESLLTKAGRKIGSLGIYTAELKYPEPAAKGTVNVPTFVPFLGGNTLGIEETQAQVKLEVPSVGSGMLEGGGQTGFSAAGSTVLGGVTFRMKVKIDETGLKTSDGEFKFKLSGKIKKEESLLKVIPPLVPIVQTIESFSSRAAAVLRDRAKAKLELEPQINVLLRVIEDAFGDLQFESGGLEPAIGVKVTATIELVKDILKASAGAGGEVAARFKARPFELERVQLKLQAFAEIVLFRYKATASKGHIWFWPGAGAAAADTVDAAGAIWSPLDRGYLNDPNYARWTAPAIAPAGLQALAADVELVANVYPQAQPSLALGGARRLLTWSHDRPDAPASAGGEIAFSTSPGSGRPWTTGSQVTNDDRDDYNRQVVFVPTGSAIAVWERFDSPSPGDPNTDPRGYLSHVQIAAARWNGTTWSAPQQLSTSGSFNSRPQLGATSTGALAVWIGNAGGRIVGDAAQPDTIYFAHYTAATNSWSAPGAVATDLAGLLELRLATSGAHAVIVYAQDRDGEPGTDADQEIFQLTRTGTSWGVPVRVSSNDVADDSPQLVLTTTGTPQLIWRQDGRLKFLNGSWDVANAVDVPLPDAAQASDLRLVRATDGDLALTWQQPGTPDTRVGYSIFDATLNLWGLGQTIDPPITSTITGTSTLATNITSALEPDRLLLAYQLAAVEAASVTLDDGTIVPNVPRIGAHSLRYSELPLGRNLSVAPVDVRAAPADAAPADPVTITAVVRNDGQLAVPAFQVDLRHGLTSTTILTRPVEPLPAGAAVTVTFPLSQTSGISTLTVVVDARGSVREANEDDNEVMVGLNLHVTPLPPIYGPAGIEARARVEQHGAIHGGHLVTASLRLNAPEGPELAQTALGFPEGLDQDAMTATVLITPTQLGRGRHTLYWQVGPTARWADPSDEDNWGVAELDVLPDLVMPSDLLDFGTLPGATAPVTINVVNQGSWSSSGGRVSFFDRDPDQSGAVTLGSVDLPEIAAGDAVSLTGTLELGASPSQGTGLAVLWAQIDPDRVVDESNENNNLIAAGRIIGQTSGPPPAGFRVFLPTIQRETSGW